VFYGFEAWIFLFLGLRGFILENILSDGVFAWGWMILIVALEFKSPLPDGRGLDWGDGRGVVKSGKVRRWERNKEDDGFLSRIRGGLFVGNDKKRRWRGWVVLVLLGRAFWCWLVDRSLTGLLPK